MIKAWFLLFRPWSYVTTAVPFLLAAALAPQGDLRRERWALGFLAGLLFQATVNLLNTWGDERSGVDDVPGAIRTTPQVHEGFVSMRALLAAGLFCAGLAAGLGVALCCVHVGGAWQIDWVLLTAGFVGFLGSTNYSTGIRYKYVGLGVPFVSVLMGPLETFVAYALLAGPFAFSALSWGAFGWWIFVTLPVALLVGVILHGNDMRDMPTDRAAGIQTFATRLGVRGALGYFCFCHLGVYSVAAVLLTQHVAFLLPFLALPLSLRLVRTAWGVYRSNPTVPHWRGLERGSGKIHLVFGILYALAWQISLFFA